MLASTAGPVLAPDRWDAQVTRWSLRAFCCVRRDRTCPYRGLVPDPVLETTPRDRARRADRAWRGRSRRGPGRLRLRPVRLPGHAPLRDAVDRARGRAARRRDPRLALAVAAPRRGRRRRLREPYRA